MARDCQTFTHHGFGAMRDFVLVECTEHPDWARAVKQKSEQGQPSARQIAEQMGREHEVTS